MNPCEMPNVSFNTFAMGARQFVVQLAFETFLSLSGLKALSFTPMQIVTSGSLDRKSTRLNSSHSQISYAVFCLKKKKKESQRYSSKISIYTSLNWT